MSLRWTPHEEAFLVEHLEVGHDFEWIAAVLDRTLTEAVIKVVELYQDGTVMTMRSRRWSLNSASGLNHSEFRRLVP